MDLKRALFDAWKSDPSKISIVDEDQRWTLDQVVRRALVLSQFIAVSDRSETGHVAVILPNGELFATAFFACMAADRAAVPINFLLSPPEVRFILEHSRSRLVLTVSHFRPLVEAAKADGAIDINPLYLDELLAGLSPEQVQYGLQSVAPERLAEADGDPNRAAALIYTSGTTGIAKGVILSHRNLIDNYHGMHKALDIHGWDIFLCVLPLFHSFGMTTAMILPLLGGCTAVMQKRFHPASVVEAIERERVTALLMVPSMFALVGRTAAPAPQRIATVRIAVSGGGPLQAAVAEEFERQAGFPVYQGYGLTEAAPVVAANVPGVNRPGSVGRPIPGVEAQIRDDAGAVLPPGVDGDIWVRGANVMVGYYRNPEATAEAIDANGWLRTGDTGQLDADGFLYVTGRKKELIIFGGEKIFPQEVENVLATHPAIAEAAVVGVTDPLRGEFPRAFLVLREGRTIEERPLRHWLAERLAGFKIPRDFEVVPALPKNALNKVLKHELRKSAEEKLKG